MSGKPKKIDKKLLKWMAVRQCTQAEMAEALGVHADTLRNHFSAQLASWRSVGKTRLRAMQWRRCRKGSDSMLIHLGNQYLGQSSKAQIEVLGEQFDPLAAYTDDPALLERALQLERDAYAAHQALAAFDTGEAGLSGMAVPAPLAEARDVRDADDDRSDGQPGSGVDPG